MKEGCSYNPTHEEVKRADETPPSSESDINKPNRLKNWIAGMTIAASMASLPVAEQAETTNPNSPQQPNIESNYFSGNQSTEEMSFMTGRTETASMAAKKEYVQTPEQARTKALLYMAGGEYTNNKNTSICASTDKYCGATVVFAESKTNQTQSYLNKSLIGKIRTKLNSGQMVYMLKGEAYVFDANNLKVGYRSIKKYDKNGKYSLVTNTNKSECYYPKIVWDKNIGIGLSDGTKITYQLTAGKYMELKNPQMLGTQEQRIKHELNSLYNGVRNKIKNPLNLNLTEINQYIKTGSDEGLKSFQVVKGKLASFVMVTGGKYGLNELYSKSIEAAVKRFDEIDPNILKELVEKNGLQTVTYDNPTYPYFPRLPSSCGATYYSYDYGKVIYINQNMYTKYLGQYSMDYCIKTMNPTTMELLWVESRGIYSLDTMNLSYNDGGVYKSKWLIAQCEKYKDKLTSKEYSYIKNEGENAIKFYS